MTHDISTGTGSTRRMFVRPNDHVGPAFGGDELIFDASELDHPAFAAALWTGEERAAAEQAVESQRQKVNAAAVANSIVRDVDRTLAAAVAERKRKKEAERTALPADR